MSYGFRFENQIVDIVGKLEEREQAETRFTNRSVRPNTKTPGLQPISVDQVTQHIPGDQRVKALPIPCHIEWEESVQRDARKREFTRSGQGSCAFTKHRANLVLVPDVLIRVRKGPPGRKSVWFRVVSTKTTRGLMQGYSDLIEFDLEQVDFQPERS